MSLLTKASMVMTPNAIKESKVYSIIPSNGNGDLTFTRDTAATQINSLGNVENVLTTIPRLNYDSVGGCPSLLLEPQRTNLVLRSEEFENPYWIKTASGVGSISITSNYSTSPSGAITADRLLANNVGATTISSSVITVTNGFSYTISIYAKSNTSNSYTYALRDGYSGTVSSNFSITPTWQRFNLTFTAVGIIAELQLRTLVIGTSDISIWGAQIEQGAYPTSYIPTTTSAVTRNADVCSKSGISDLIGQTEGTIFFNIKGFLNDLSTNRFITYSDGTTNNMIGIYYTTSGVIWGYFRVNSVTNTIVSTISQNINSKIILRYIGNVYTLFINGTLINNLTILSGFSSPLTTLKFSQANDTSPFNGNVNSIQIYKTALTDTECISLTQ